MNAKRKRESATVAAYLVMLAAALAALGMTAANAWAAPPRPDLVVVGIGAQPTGAVQGGTIVVSDAVTNAGRARAGRSAVRLYLSSDRSLGSGDVRLADRPTGALRPGRLSTAATTVTVPAQTAIGSYYLVACADARRTVAESRERNNCRASASPIPVTAPVAPELPVPAPDHDHGDHDHDDHDHGEVPEPSAG
jgi:hypothetical protein